MPCSAQKLPPTLQLFRIRLKIEGSFKSDLLGYFVYWAELQVLDPPQGLVKGEKRMFSFLLSMNYSQKPDL